MPTSNGLITARDIRQKAVKTLHIVDEAVTTAKIPDLAVTYPDKIDAPFWVYAFESEPFINASLNTTPQEVATITIDVPAWVGQVSVFAIGVSAINNSSGGDLNVYASVRVNDNDDGNFRITVINGDIGHAVHAENANIVVPGTTFEVSLYSYLDSGTNAVNKGAVWGMAIGQR